MNAYELNEIIDNNLYLECLKQNNPMGNHIPAGIPPLLVKNWQPVPDHPNSFRNKLTSQYTHKHIINVQSVLQIQSFKSRMKQTNLYICRVFFYHQYHQSIYHVYTDQIHLQPNVSKPQVWKLHKIKIMESFWQLAQKYGFMKVCRQMIGADTSGHPKIWIHPDPVASKPWSTWDSQYSMVTEILSILQYIQQRATIKQTKIIGNSLINCSQIQYTSFQQFITSQTQLLNSKYSQNRSKVNRSSSIFQNNQAVNSMATSSQLMNTKKVRNNKTYAFDTKYSTSNVKGTHDTEPRRSNEKYIKNNQLQKIQNPVLCETTRVQQIVGEFKYRQNHISNGSNTYTQQRKNLPIERPMTYNYTQYIPIIANITDAGDNSKQIAPFNTLEGSIPKRRETQKLKAQKIHQLNASITKQEIYLKYKSIVKKKISAPLGQTKITNDKYNENYNNDYLNLNNIPSSREATNNQLQKLLSQVPKAGIVNITLPTYQRQNKKIQTTSYHNKVDSSLQSIQSTDKSRQKLAQIPKRQHKTYVMPNFLMKSFAQTERSPQSKYSMPKNPSTQRHQRDPYPLSSNQNQLTPNQLMKTNINIISTKSIDENSQQYNQQKSKKDTVSLLKYQLNFIMETPIQPKPKPISVEYEKFKSSRNLYQDQGKALESEKDQFDIIKEKVQQKKAKFAQLKKDARKILEDDF